MEDIDKYKINKYNNFKFYDKSDESTIKDYASFQTLKTLKQNPNYYLSKWNVILNHLINLDNYLNYLEKEDEMPHKEVKSINEKYTFHTKKKRDKKYKQIMKESSDLNQSEDSIYIKFKSNSESSSIIASNENISNDQIKSDMEEFKLNYMRKSLRLLGFEEVEENNFKDYAKRTLYLMLLILKIDYYEFLNPHYILYKELMNISNIKNEKEDYAENYEIDLVINKFQLKDLDLLLSKYPKHFLLKEQLKLNEIDDNEINIVSEITTDLIKNIDNKSNKLTKYINVLNTFNSFTINHLIDDSKKSVIDSFKINPFNQNIFIIITNGSYFLLQFVINIINNIFKDNIYPDKINEFIENKIISEKSILINNIIKKKKYFN